MAPHLFGVILPVSDIADAARFYGGENPFGNQLCFVDAATTLTGRE